MNHLMIDLETLGRRPDAIITQIGGVFFSPTGIPGEYGDTFTADVDIASQKGRTVSTNTIQFWLTQPHEASAHIVSEENPSLNSVLQDFRSFVVLNTQDKEKLMVWANGAAFDFPMLDDAFEFCQMEMPWVYHQVNDLRTLRNKAHPKRCQETYDSDLANGIGLTKHKAVEDCIQQVAMLQELLGNLQGGCSFCTG